MKNVRNVFRFLSILVLLVLFYNCQNDTNNELEVEAVATMRLPINTSILTKQDLIAHPKIQHKIRSLTTVQNYNFGESSSSNVHDFEVSVNEAKLVENIENGYHSYTFPIYRTYDTGSILENLVFSYNSYIDDYDAYIVTYYYSASQKQELLNSQTVTGIYEISNETISVNLSDILAENTYLEPCTSSETVFHITPDSDELFLHTDEQSGTYNACQHEDGDNGTDCETITVITYDCGDGSGTAGGQQGDVVNNGTNPGASSNSNNNTNSNTQNTNNGQGQVITSPTVRTTDDILNDVLGEENWEYTEHDPNEEIPSFETQEELKAYFESLQEGNFEHINSEIDDQGNTVRDFHKMTINPSFNTDLIAIVKRKTFPYGTMTLMHPDDIIGVRTQLEGNHFIFQYEQTDDEGFSNAASSPVIEIDQQVNSLRIKVQGSLTSKVKFQGHDISHGASITIVLTYNLITFELKPQYSIWHFNLFN